MGEKEKPSHCVKIKVYGTVQGVGFRHAMRVKAQHLHVSGECHNSRDGSVSCTAEGDEDELRELIRWSYHGPSGADVEKVHTEWQTPHGRYHGFEIRSS